MSHKIAVSLVLASVAMPITVAAAGVFHAELNNSDGVVVSTQDSTGPDFIFTGVAEGSYTMTVCRYDVNGTAMAPAISQGFAVSADTVMVDLPSSMTINVATE
jgi:hypothetical protein